jgi:hypothetical protein
MRFDDGAAEPLLRSHGSGEGCALACQEPSTLVV